MDRPVTSLMELRRVHRRLRRWGRDLPYEEFAGWRLDREAPRRTWREVNRRQRLSFVYGTAVVVVLTAAVTGPLAEMTSLPLVRRPVVAVADSGSNTTVAALPGAGVPLVPPASPPAAPAATLPPERSEPYVPSPSDGAPPGAAPSDNTSSTPARQAWQQRGERGQATVASLEAATLAEHATAASVIVAGRVEAFADDAVILRVELALKGTVEDIVHIVMPSAATSLAGLEPGTRLLAYLAEPDEVIPEAESAPLTLRPAGNGALVGLSPLNSPER